MKEITEEELDAAMEDASIVQQISVIEMLFVLCIAAIIAFAAYLYHLEASGRNLSHLDQGQSISQGLSSDGHSK